MSMTKRLYLILAISGLIGPWYFNLFFFQDHSFQEFIDLTHANLATQSLSMDLFISTVAGSVYFLYEGKRLKMAWPILYVLIAFCVAFSFALPLFLFVRENHLDSNSRSDKGSNIKPFRA